MPLIGTAGHVDHGKSTLVQALTGRDPDRWAEEKRRGLTIDLGFAWARLPGGTEVSFVDVPGHERYLKNMLAGIEAIDIALVVVAADEGWMPQSEEHLAVLDLLGVERGVVALTKIDAVDGDLQELAAIEVSERLDGTTLSSAPIVPVSSKTGEGLDRLTLELDALVEGLPAPDRGRPRLWVDRSFTASGAGTVVTGSLLGGPLAVGAEVEVFPRAITGKIRGIQSHESVSDEVEPGRRVALNLGSVERDQVERGDMIGLPGDWETSDRVAVRLQSARYVEELDQRGDYQIHLGSAVAPAGIVGMEMGVAIVRLRRPLPMSVGDRFILRDTGRKLVVGGGRVLDMAPGKTLAAIRAAGLIDPSASPGEIATAILRERGMESSRRLARQTGGRPLEGVQAGDWVLDLATTERLEQEAIALVTREHADRPMRAGLPMATLAERIAVPPEVAEMIVDRSTELVRQGPDVALRGWEIDLSAESMAEWERARGVLEQSLAVPSVDDLGLDPELMHLMIRKGNLVRVSADLVFLPSQIERIHEVLRTLDDGFTVADFRDAAGLSRKYAVPILEWADRESITTRSGDRRSLR